MGVIACNREAPPHPDPLPPGATGFVQRFPSFKETMKAVQQRCNDVFRTNRHSCKSRKLNPCPFRFPFWRGCRIGSGLAPCLRSGDSQVPPEDPGQAVPLLAQTPGRQPPPVRLPLLTGTAPRRLRPAPVPLPAGAAGWAGHSRHDGRGKPRRSRKGGNPEPADRRSPKGGNPEPADRRSPKGGNPEPADRRSPKGGNPEPADRRSPKGGNLEPADRRSRKGGNLELADRRSRKGGNPEPGKSSLTSGPIPAGPVWQGNRGKGN